MLFLHFGQICSVVFSSINSAGYLSPHTSISSSFGILHPSFMYLRSLETFSGDRTRHDFYRVGQVKFFWDCDRHREDLCGICLSIRKQRYIDSQAIVVVITHIRHDCCFGRCPKPNQHTVICGKVKRRIHIKIHAAWESVTIDLRLKILAHDRFLARYGFRFHRACRRNMILVYCGLRTRICYFLCRLFRTEHHRYVRPCGSGGRWSCSCCRGC